MKLSIAILSLSALVVDAGCPFSETTSDAPNDDHHRHLRHGPLASLGEGAAKDKLANIIGNQKIKTGDRRSLIQTSCMTETHYDDIRDNIADMATVVRTIIDIVRLMPTLIVMPFVFTFIFQSSL